MPGDFFGRVQYWSWTSRFENARELCECDSTKPSYLFLTRSVQYTLNKKILNGRGNSMVTLLLVQWRNFRDFTASIYKEFTPGLMFTKYEADRLCQNITYITTKDFGFRVSLPLTGCFKKFLECSQEGMYNYSILFWLSLLESTEKSLFRASIMTRS